MLVKLFRGLFCVYAFLLFIVGMFCVLPFVVVFSFQEPKKGGDNIYRFCRYWDTAWMTLVGIRYSTVFESLPDAEQQYV
ncbi:MAG TPA: hypothetical protein VNU72_04515, partial [Puia sp.]|nr:hypothetical protein [Puia sp.]